MTHLWKKEVSKIQMKLLNLECIKGMYKDFQDLINFNLIQIVMSFKKVEFML